MSSFVRTKQPNRAGVLGVLRFALREAEGAMPWVEAGEVPYAQELQQTIPALKAAVRYIEGDGTYEPPIRNE